MTELRQPKRLKSFQSASHRRSPTQEHELAGKLGGRRVVGSGCGVEKGDVRVEGLIRVETKTTKNKSFSVTREMLDKIEQASINSGEIPSVVIEFNDDGKPVGSLAVIPMWAFEDLVRRCNVNIK